MWFRNGNKSVFVEFIRLNYSDLKNQYSIPCWVLLVVEYSGIFSIGTGPFTGFAINMSPKVSRIRELKNV